MGDGIWGESYSAPAPYAGYAPGASVSRTIDAPEGWERRLGTGFHERFGWHKKIGEDAMFERERAKVAWGSASLRDGPHRCATGALSCTLAGTTAHRAPRTR